MGQEQPLVVTDPAGVFSWELPRDFVPSELAAAEVVPVKWCQPIIKEVFRTIHAISNLEALEVLQEVQRAYLLFMRRLWGPIRPAGASVRVVATAEGWQLSDPAFGTVTWRSLNSSEAVNPELLRRLGPDLQDWTGAILQIVAPALLICLGEPERVRVPGGGSLMDYVLYAEQDFRDAHSCLVFENGIALKLHGILLHANWLTSHPHNQ
ncbi:MAG TPA: hypothetical protein VLI05_06980 [Candidatus Saccharimonadia bacterium]|nr:hypothetical protein [Candidatus Saccharimonadia bacterium]